MPARRVVKDRGYVEALPLHEPVQRHDSRLRPSHSTTLSEDNPFCTNGKDHQSGRQRALGDAAHDCVGKPDVIEGGSCLQEENTARISTECTVDCMRADICLYKHDLIHNEICERT